MSYDVSLEIKTGPETSAEVFWINHTSNTAEMWRSAGCDLKDFHGKLASDLEAPLRKAVETIKANPERFKQYASPSGWGTVETTVEFLSEILEAVVENPYTTVNVSA